MKSYKPGVTISDLGGNAVNEVIGGVFLKVCKLTSVIHLCPSHHLCLETRYCSLKSLLLYPVHYPTWSQYNMLSIENENELSTNFCILLDKHWHFQVASRVTEGGACRKGGEKIGSSHIYILDEFHNHHLSCCFVLGQVEKCK